MLEIVMFGIYSEPVYKVFRNLFLTTIRVKLLPLLKIRKLICPTLGMLGRPVDRGIRQHVQRLNVNHEESARQFCGVVRKLGHFGHFRSNHVHH
jgi:hypothetical protein